MPAASSPSTSKRLLALLSLLQAQRDWPAHVLAERLGVSERTVRRDVDRLRELDYAVDAARGYRLGAGTSLPPLLLDDEQAVAIALALRAAGALGAGIEDAADSALGTLGRTMPARLAHRIGDLEHTTATRRPADAVADPEVLLRIGAAIRAQQELRFDYPSPARDGSAAEAAPVRRTEPHHLLLHAGRWYVIGWSAERADWRTFRVDRMTPRTHTGRRFTRRTVPGGDAARFLAARFTGSSGVDAWPCLGEVVLRAPLADVAPYVGDGTVEPLGDDRCRLRLGAWSWAGLAATVGRFDADIDAVEPPELARAFTELARRFAAAGGAVSGPRAPTAAPGRRRATAGG